MWWAGEGKRPTWRDAGLECFYIYRYSIHPPAHELWAPEFWSFDFIVGAVSFHAGRKGFLNITFVWVVYCCETLLHVIKCSSTKTRFYEKAFCELEAVLDWGQNLLEYVFCNFLLPVHELLSCIDVWCCVVNYQGKTTLKGIEMQSMYSWREPKKY